MMIVLCCSGLVRTNGESCYIILENLSECKFVGRDCVILPYVKAAFGSDWILSNVPSARLNSIQFVFH